MYGASFGRSCTISAAHWPGALLVIALFFCPAEALRADEGSPPGVIHFCWTNCFTLRFDHGLYRRTDGSEETWTVERFTSRSVILRRHDVPADWNGFSSGVAYQGQVLDERLINVTVNGNPVPDIALAWGAALDTLPGSNAERDQRLKMQAFNGSPPPPPADADPAAEGQMRAAEAPPPLVNDEQPPCSEEGSLWTPGYWAWSGGGYYWVPGAWVLPPRVGVLWTPGYWGYSGGVYVFHPGYWGPHVGFYGGINYGFGYVGAGFAGGRWMGNSFAYNRAVNNVDDTIVHNTYSLTVADHVANNKVSYNGGPGGTMAVATAEERAAAAEAHHPPTPLHRHVVQQATRSPALMAQANGAHPANAVMHRSAVSNAPRAAAQGTAAPPSGGQPKLAAARPSATAQPQDEGAQPVAPKPTGAKTTKPQVHPKQ
ncbi:MAG: hypothetical protein ACLQT5_15105 [Steroidobacteraceae bacterium]